jgi:helicase MOV-10
VEAIRQVLVHHPEARILACAPSNSAADLIVSRLTALGNDVLFRFYAPSRPKDQVPAELLPFTAINDDRHFSIPPMSRLKRFRVIVSTCVSASFAYGVGLPRGHFSHLFFDEAGQATEPEVMIAIKTIADNSTNIILSGDPKQLGPIIRSSVARELGLETSYLERLMDREIYKEKNGRGM